MSISGIAWECSCGHVEYSEEPPEECLKCGKLDSFIQIPLEILEERANEALEELNEQQNTPRNQKISVKNLKKTNKKSLIKNETKKKKKI